MSYTIGCPLRTRCDERDEEMIMLVTEDYGVVAMSFSLGEGVGFIMRAAFWSYVFP